MNELANSDQRILDANDKAVRLARLQDAFLNQIRKDMVENDLTALDELFYQILKVDGAINLMIDYLPETEQVSFLELVDSPAEL